MLKIIDRWGNFLSWILKSPGEVSIRPSSSRKTTAQSLARTSRSNYNCSSCIDFTYYSQLWSLESNMDALFQFIMFFKSQFNFLAHFKISLYDLAKLILLIFQFIHQSLGVGVANLIGFEYWIDQCGVRNQLSFLIVVLLLINLKGWCGYSGSIQPKSSPDCHLNAGFQAKLKHNLSANQELLIFLGPHSAWKNHRVLSK